MKGVGWCSGMNVGLDMYIPTKSIGERVTFDRITFDL